MSGGRSRATLPAPEHPDVDTSRIDRRRPRAARRQRGGDGLLTTLLKAAAYSRAPRLTFAVLHPRRAARLKKLSFDLRTAYAPRVTAVAAAVLALPLGVAIGRAIERRSTARADATGSADAERPPGAERPRIAPRV